GRRDRSGGSRLAHAVTVAIMRAPSSRASNTRGGVEGRSHGASHRPQLLPSLTGAEPLRFQPGEKAFALMAAPVLRRSIVSAQPGTLKGVRRNFGAGQFVTAFLRHASFPPGSRRRAQSMPAASLE